VRKYSYRVFLFLIFKVGKLNKQAYNKLIIIIIIMIIMIVIVIVIMIMIIIITLLICGDLAEG